MQNGRASIMKVLKSVFVLLMVTLALPGCEGAGNGSGDKAREAKIVRVGDIVLTEDNLASIMPAGERVPFTPEERRLFVERWVDLEVLYQEAVRRGLKEDARIRARLRSLEQELLADHLVFIELHDRTVVTEEEVEEYFNEHESEYLYEYRVSHILVNTLEEAENVKELLRKRSFIWVANRHSVDPVARYGGDLGYLTKGNMIHAFEKVIFDMKPGETSDIIKSDFGYHIIKLIGMRESLNKIGYEDVREQIMNTLMIEKREKAYAEFIDSLRSSADVEYFSRAYITGTAEGTKADSL